MNPPESLLPRRPRWRAVGALGLTAALLSATTACLPDQVDGRQEGSGARPIVDLSWWQEATAADAVDAALLAMAEIGSVRLTQDAESPLPGEVADGDGSVRVVSKDLLIAAGAGLGDAAAGDCTGTLQLPGWSTPAELVVQAGLGAFRGDADFWVGFGDNYPEVPDAGAQLAEQYADAWTTTPGLASLCELGDFLGPVSAMVGDDDVVKAGLGDVAGVPAGRLVAGGKKRTVTAWVQVAEPHLVLQVAIEQSGAGRGSSAGRPTERTVTTFSEFDSTVGVDFPKVASILAFEAPGASTGPEPAATPSPAPTPAPGSTTTPTPVPTPVPTPGPTPGSTPGPTPGSTPGSTPSPTPAPTPTRTPSPTPTPTLTPPSPPLPGAGRSGTTDG